VILLGQFSQFFRRDPARSWRKVEFSLRRAALQLRRTFSLRFSLIFAFASFVSVPFYFATLSPTSILPARIDFFIWCFFPQVVHLYSIAILFVTFVFLFHDFGAGLDRLPKLPVPPRSPRAFSRDAEPRDIGWVADLDFCLAVPTV